MFFWWSKKRPEPAPAPPPVSGPIPFDVSATVTKGEVVVQIGAIGEAGSVRITMNPVQTRAMRNGLRAALLALGEEVGP